MEIKRALRLDKKDNVATLLQAAEKGEEITVFGDDQNPVFQMKAADAIPQGHKIALEDVAKGLPVIKYGQVISVANGSVRRGDRVHVHNTESLRGRGDKCNSTEPDNVVSGGAAAKNLLTEAFYGQETGRSGSLMLFKRPDGRFGIRNRIAVISTVACANHVAEQIAAGSRIADAYTHAYGCDQLGEDAALSRRILIAMGCHPNTGAALVVGLGCEAFPARELADEIRRLSGKPAEALVIQDTGGTSESVAAGRVLCERLTAQLTDQERQPASLSDLTVAVECGGSDYTSGLASNPAVGIMTDLLCKVGAKVIFGETSELMGAEALLESRCETPEILRFITGKIQLIENYAKSLKVDIRGSQPSPGNIEGGLSTIEEKSLGAVCKSGSTAVKSVLDFGEAPNTPGLSFMDTPGNDLACTLGLAAAGAQIVVFTTGRGTPMGFAAAPLIKVTANENTARRMAENIDADLSGLLTGGISFSQAGQQLFDMVLKTAGGRETAAERLGHKEFGLYRISQMLL